MSETTQDQPQAQEIQLLPIGDIAAWLQANPQFFEEHAELIAQIVIPHPHGGRAISITERQLLTLREKNRELENKLGDLLTFGEQNDAISEKMHRLSVALIAAATFPSLISLLEFHLREDFAVPHVALRLWRAPAGAELLAEEENSAFATVGEEMQAMAETLTRPYCGATTGFDTSAWFGEHAAHIRSQALIALRNGGGSIGLIALGSEDPQRFYADMGTLYLERLGELVSAALARVHPQD